MKKERNKGSIEAIYRLGEYFKWLLLAIVTLTVTVIIYPSLIVKQQTYQLGDVVEHDIKAPKGFLFEDKTATATNQRDAIERVLTVYDHDTTLLAKLTQNVNTAFEEMRTLLKQPGKERPGPTDETQDAP